MAQPRLAALLVRDRAEVAGAGADWLSARLGEAIAARGRASLALSGGQSPRAMYAELARRPVDWPRVDIFFVDERGVPPGDPKSNFRMVEDALLGPVGAPSVFRMPADAADLEAAAEDYAETLPDDIDVMVLGVGEDGHTASLFPRAGVDWSRPTGRKVVATRAPVAPHERLSITPDVIGRARAVLVLATGSDKADIVAAALEGAEDARRHPIHIVRGATWLLDRDAAARLSQESRHA